VGIVTLDDLKKARRQARDTDTVGEIMRDVPRVDPDADAFDMLGQLQGSGSLDAIVQRDGELFGVLTEADYAHAMTIQRGFRSGVGA